MSKGRDVFGSIDSIGNFEKNICFCPKIDILPRGKPTVLGQKKRPNLTKFSSRYFLHLYVPRDLGES